MHRLKLISRLLFCAVLVLTVTASAVPVPVLADESSDSSEQSLPWPDAPGISAEGAILVEAESGAILYGKNIHEAYYPASITKLLTGLIAYENLDLTDTVTLSEQAVYSIPWDGTNIGMDMGESITIEQALYGLMVASANEVANGLAEKISGSQSDFADLMNQRAAELGCRDSHFVNAHGLFDSDHYVSPYDMAQIARAYFSYDDLCDIAGTVSYHFVATDTQPDDFWLNSRNRLVNGNIEYDGIVGGKTGYTDEARETLVTCAERDGMKLICVILKDEPPYHFEDTVTLLDYGFDNFQRLTVDSLQGGGAYPESGFMTKGNDIFGNSASPLAIDSKAGVIIPKDADASMVTSTLVNSDEYINIRLSLKKTNEVRLSGITDPASQSAPIKWALYNIITETGSSETRKWYLMILPCGQNPQIFLPQAQLLLKTRPARLQETVCRLPAAAPDHLLSSGRSSTSAITGLCISISSASCLLSVSWLPPRSPLS